MRKQGARGSRGRKKGGTKIKTAEMIVEILKKHYYTYLLVIFKHYSDSLLGRNCSLVNIYLI